MSTGTLERRAEAKVWPMDEGGYAVSAADTAAAKAALTAWLTEVAGAPYEHDHSMNLEDIPEYVESRSYREGWYRWTPCNPRSCYDGKQHRPGHLSHEAGPARGAWHGVLVDYP